jgi:hypothetical protein
MRKTPMLNTSFRKTLVRNRGKSGSRWVSFSASNEALANFTGGFPATAEPRLGVGVFCGDALAALN